MISKAKKGQSFKGAALYFLHDKNALTTERVDFTHTGNLATNDPEMAARMMAYTAMHQEEIKRAAGGVLKGRKTTKPVYAYSISWHPSQEPTQEQMIEAGHQSLKAVGLDGYEFIMAAHNDEDHKHLHLIVNRIHPETGIAAKLSNDFRHLSTWAEQYERSHGKIFCKQRVENNKKRQNGKFVKYRQSLNKAEYHKWQREKARQSFDKRQKDEKHLSEIHKKQRDELFKAKQDQLEETRLKLKKAHRLKWAVIYAQQKGERQVLKDAQRSAMGRLTYYIINRNQNRPKGELTIRGGLLSGAFNAIRNGNDLNKSLDKKHKQQRKAFSRIVEKNNRSTIEKVKNSYNKEFSRLQEAQRGERKIQKTRHIEESKKLAEALRSGKTEKDFKREKRNKYLADLSNELIHGKVGEDLDRKKGGEDLHLKKDFAATGGRKGKDMTPDNVKSDFDQADERTQKDIDREQLRKDLGGSSHTAQKETKDKELKKDFEKAGDRQEIDSKGGELTKEFNVTSGKTQEDTERKKTDKDMRQLRADLVKNTGLDEVKEPEKSKEKEEQPKRRPRSPRGPGHGR